MKLNPNKKLARESAYVRNSTIIKDDKACCHRLCAKSPKSLWLQWTSHYVAWRKFCASTTFKDGLVISTGREPKVIIDVRCFTSRSKWSAKIHVLFLFFWFMQICNSDDIENYFIFVQSRPFIHFVLFQAFTKLGTVPKILTPASWTDITQKKKKLRTEWSWQVLINDSNTPKKWEC